MLAGALGGLTGVLWHILAQFVVAYGFADLLRQDPFEQSDFLRSGAPSLKAYLFSPKGIYDFTWTAGVGLLFGFAFGALLGTVGGLLRRTRRPAAG